jgi:hypothetical protein
MSSFYPQNRLQQECHLYFLFVFEKVKIDKIYKDDLKNQEMVVKQQLSKSIKNDISFEKKLHDEVPSGKNYIIKNIKGNS